MHPFLMASTLARGTVPYLPDEVRRLVWTHVLFPMPILWCGSCGVPVLQRTKDNTYEYVDTHPSMWADTPRCIHCRGHPML